MSQCLTKYHGELEYDELSVLQFVRGPFGFAEETRFLPIEQPALRPLVFLQSLATPELCFISLPVFLVDKQYSLSISPEDLEAVGLPPDRESRIGEDILCLVIVCLQQGGPATANLLAPVVVNRHNSKAIQALSLNRKHTHQVPLAAPTEVSACL